MLRVLFIEDEENSVKPVILHLNRESKRYECKVSNFGAAQQEALAFRPDVVILDILDGGGSGEPEPEGNKTLDFVWTSQFCPVVIYSAHLDLLAEGAWSSHPFVKMVQKGSGSELQIENALNLFDPHVIALHEAESFVRGVFANSMRDVARYAFDEITDETGRKDAILRCGRRRVAASMDDTGSTLRSWEVYIHPPVSASVKIGDILRMKEGSTDDPASFRIVLTPSCDMVAGRTNRIDNVLVARCFDNNTGLQAVGMAGVKRADAVRNGLLTTGHRDGIMPLPSLKGRIPPLMADLKKLELLPLPDIGDETKKYVRIASIDSPFRELVAWAYSNTACRPGLPDRDFDTWASEICPDKSAGK